MCFYIQTHTYIYIQTCTERERGSICVCMQACMYYVCVCVNVCVCMHTCICMQVCMYMYMWICIHVFSHMHLCMYECTLYECTHACMQVCTIPMCIPMHTIVTCRPQTHGQTTQPSPSCYLHFRRACGWWRCSCSSL